MSAAERTNWCVRWVDHDGTEHSEMHCTPASAAARYRTIRATAKSGAIWEQTRAIGFGP